MTHTQSIQLDIIAHFIYCILFIFLPCIEFIIACILIGLTSLTLTAKLIKAYANCSW